MVTPSLPTPGSSPPIASSTIIINSFVHSSIVSQTMKSEHILAHSTQAASSKKFLQFEAFDRLVSPEAAAAEAAVVHAVGTST